MLATCRAGSGNRRNKGGNIFHLLRSRWQMWMIREHLEVSGTKAVFAVVAGEGQIPVPGQAVLCLGARAGSGRSEIPGARRHLRALTACGERDQAAWGSPGALPSPRRAQPRGHGAPSPDPPWPSGHRSVKGMPPLQMMEGAFLQDDGGLGTLSLPSGVRMGPISGAEMPPPESCPPGDRPLYSLGRLSEGDGGPKS